MKTIFLNWRVTVLGVLTWAIPFALSIPFFDPKAGLVIPILLFKQVMVVIGTLTGTALLVWVFRSVSPTLFSGFVVGLYWLILNWLLDILVLVPMSGGDVGKWFTEIGLGYLSILFIAVGMGIVGGRRG